MGLLGYVTSQPWAITPAMYETVLDVAARENEPWEAVAARLGKPLENARRATTRDGVAIVPVHGVIARRMNLFSEVSGGTSIEVLARDFRAAMDDPEVSAVLLDVDSPGGAVNGTGEFAAMVRAARGVKPVCAYVGGMGCSAAYWIASAADEVVASPHGFLGSIGVLYSATDRTAADERRGVKHHTIVSRQSPLKALDAATDRGRTHIEDIATRTAALFIDAVAENRGVAPDYVESDFGQGAVMLGAEAIACGMADRLGSFEQVLQELASGRHRRATTTQAVPAAPIEVSTMDSTTTGAAADNQAGAPVHGSNQAQTQASAGAVDMAEFERMKAQLAALSGSHATEREARIRAEADAFLATNRAKIPPAEQASAREAYVQAATDDALHPLAAGSRVATLKAQAAARPALPVLGAGIGALPAGAAILPTGDESPAAQSGALPGELLRPDGQSNTPSGLTAEQMAQFDPELAAAFAARPTPAGAR